MKARRFEPSDFEQISQWALDYDTIYDEEQFPSVGFIVDGLAAYFLYQTDSKVCFLENLIANKSADKISREKAIELVINEILKEAEIRGYKVAYATTGLSAVIVRAMTHGAQATPKQTLLTKKLGQSHSRDRLN